MNSQLDQFVRLEGVAQVTELADVGRADAVDAELDQSIEREVVVAEIVEFPDAGAGYVVDGQFEERLGVEVVVAKGVKGRDIVRVGREDECAATAAITKATFAGQGAGVAQHFELDRKS